MIKLFFDECCSSRLPLRLEELYKEDYPELITKHLGEYVRKGSSDSEWITLLSKETDWVVISTDRGKGTNKEKLPLLCANLEITHVLFTAGLLNRGYTAHKQALITVWPHLIRVASIKKGTRLSLGMRTSKGGTESFALTIQGKPLATVYPFRPE